ncbi:hypothetical protein FFI89_025080 [Bradyrhizobium sp. KBS0727]|uniref:hypothetical protein n=1 Tax=unclassified Bradyrhizobium TaxID=2631580 RepID=UPI00110EC7F1|nr:MULTISPECIES: hypothetical protein [unclassified Bradyrhizobium]QDW40120.1 hypothetical protein FFI71_025085 [Bradyrhizobium sp. KBS0725]QDW46723.1 hypothetical protein FFI89_025080 [Bradyrhizobium sp. KBS0727]
MHILSGDAGSSSLGGALARWLKTAVAVCARKNRLRGVQRAEFEQIAQDLNLSPPELYRLLTSRHLSADALEQRLAAELGSAQLSKRLRAIERQRRAARIRASIPIGPSCC